jgi:hypothetical protein
MIFAATMYLFTTHLKLVSFPHWIHTHDKIIAIVAIAAVAVITAVVWFVRRRQTRA